MTSREDPKTARRIPHAMPETDKLEAAVSARLLLLLFLFAAVPPSASELSVRHALFFSFWYIFVFDRRTKKRPSKR